MYQHDCFSKYQSTEIEKKYGTKASLTLRAVDLCVPKAGPISVKNRVKCLSWFFFGAGRLWG